MEKESVNGVLIELDNSFSGSEGSYADSVLPFTVRPDVPEALPEQLRQMKHLYRYGSESLEEKAKNFYRQGMFMKDYEDDASWSLDFTCYFPSYHDLTTKQLRGYFSWRTRLRRGEYHPIAASAAYIYIYELLNGIGTSSPEQSLRKMMEFDARYLGCGYGDSRMRSNLTRWMLEFSILKDLPPETVKQFIPPDVQLSDTSLCVLQDPLDHSDEEVFDALCFFAGKKLSQSPAAAQERGRHLFCEAWRCAKSSFSAGDKDLFALCFGRKTVRKWRPLANAVVYLPEKQKDRECRLNEGRIYRCRNGIWEAESFEKLLFDRNRFRGFIHETDRLLRRYLKTGRYTKPDAAAAWADPFVLKIIEDEKRSIEEAKRPKISIDLSDLDRIRTDAEQTRDALLTEADLPEQLLKVSEPDLTGRVQNASGPVLRILPPEETVSMEGETPEKDDPSLKDTGSPPEPVPYRILRELLKGGDAQPLIREHYLQPSLAADAVNEAFFDEIGDIVVTCEENTLLLVDDYRDELIQLVGV